MSVLPPLPLLIETPHQHKYTSCSSPIPFPILQDEEEDDGPSAAKRSKQAEASPSSSSSEEEEEEESESESEGEDEERYRGLFESREDRKRLMALPEVRVVVYVHVNVCGSVYERDRRSVCKRIRGVCLSLNA